MLQVNNKTGGTFKIKSVRKKIDESKHILTGAACSIEAGDGLDTPPC
jgi:hypothetical protein